MTSKSKNMKSSIFEMYKANVNTNKYVVLSLLTRSTDSNKPKMSNTYIHIADMKIC